MNRVLVAGSLTIVAVILARVFNRSPSIKILDIGEVPLKAVWVVFLAGTVAHFFAGAFFRNAILDLAYSDEASSEKVKAREDVLVDGGHFVSVMVRRLPVSGRRFVPMSLHDSSTWVAYLGALGFLVAVVPWWWQNGLRGPGVGVGLVLTSVGVLLLLVNWFVGSHWAIALSLLGEEEQLVKGALRPSYLATLHGSITAAVGLLGALVGLAAVGGFWALIDWLT